MVLFYGGLFQTSINFHIIGDYSILFHIFPGK